MLDEAIVNRWLLRAAMKYGSKTLDTRVISVTEATFPCLRKAYLDRTRKKLPTPVEALKVLGTEVHTLLQDIMRDEGYDTEVQVSINLGEFELHGRADAVKYGMGGKAEEVVEIKTTNGLHEAPLEPHKLQLRTYMQILQARAGYLIYVDRASGRIKVFRIRPDKKALRTVIERAKILHKALTKNEPPPKTTGPWCTICPHKRTCLKRWWP